jgi:hypothetical protein
MSNQRPREEAPFIVRFINGGRPTTRERMEFSLAMMLALFVVALAVWLGDPTLAWYQFLVVVALALVASQILAIRWIDRHGEWAKPE